MTKMKRLIIWLLGNSHYHFYKMEEAKVAAIEKQLREYQSFITIETTTYIHCHIVAWRVEDYTPEMEEAERKHQESIAAEHRANQEYKDAVKKMAKAAEKQAEDLSGGDDWKKGDEQ